MSGDVDSTVLQEGPPSQSEQSMYLNNLVISLRARFKQQGTSSDIDKAIELYRVVCSPGHPGRSSTLNKLDISIHDSWRRYGTMSDLDEAIKLRSSTLAQCHPDNFLDSSIPTTLPLAFVTDFSSRSPCPNWKIPLAPSSYTRILSTPPFSSIISTTLPLAFVIDLGSRALCLTWTRPSNFTGLRSHCIPLAVLSNSCLNNLVTSLRTRFAECAAPSDLDEGGH